MIEQIRRRPYQILLMSAVSTFIILPLLPAGTLGWVLLTVLFTGILLAAVNTVGGVRWRSLVVYYSFVTMTTLGYGDILPVTRLTRTLAIALAVLGQLYLVVLIARLVALHIVHTREHEG
jgi:voltage-gated potassium channel Kch